MGTFVRTLGLMLLLIVTLAAPAQSQSRQAEARPMAETTKGAAPDDESHRKAIAALNKLLEEPNLQLSTDDRIIKRFHALIRIGFPARDGNRAATYLVQRDDARVAVLILSDQGLPFCYMTNGFIALFDSGRPGRLLVHERGNVGFVLITDRKTGHPTCDIAYLSIGEISHLRLDFAALLNACLEKMSRAQLDEKSNTVELKTENALASIELADDDDRHDFPMKALTIRSNAGTSLAVGPIGIKSEPAATLFGVDLAAIEKQGVTVKRISAKDVKRLQVFVPPARFGTNPKEREAATAFMKLFTR
jgi:hypothetical protein